MSISPTINACKSIVKNLIGFVAAFSLLLFTSGGAQALVTSDTEQYTTPAIQIEKDTLVVGSEQHYPPFATGMTDETAGGFTVDLWKAVAAEAGLKYTIRVLPFNALLQEFKEGDVDILINLAISKERHYYADFTVPHAIIHGGIFVRHGETRINSEADFSGKSIIVIKSDLAHDYAVSKGWGKQLIMVSTAAEGLRLLASGKHDVMLINKLAGMQTLQALKLANVNVLKTNAGFEQKFAFAVREGHFELFSKINEALAMTKSNGTYDDLYEKWFGVYEVKEVTLLDVLNYLLPILITFLGIALYLIYQRRTENKVAQKALQESEAHLRLSQTGGGIGTWEADLVNNKQYWSENCIALLGFPAISNPTWEDFLRLVHPEDRQRVIDATQSHIEHGTKYEVEYRAVNANGSIHWMRSTGQIERDTNGKPVMMRGIAQDITERKLAEEKIKKTQIALEESRDRYQDLYEYAPIGYLSLSKHGMITEVNWKITALFGLSRKELNHHRLAEFVAEEDKGRWQRAFSSLKDLIEGEELSFDIKFNQQNGSIFNASLNCLRMHDVDNLPILRITLIDITQLKLAEDKLLRSEAFLRTIIDNEPECIKVVDARGYLKQMNPAGLAMLEADSLEQATSIPLLNFIAPEYQPAFKDLHKRVIAGEAMQLEFEVIGLKGARRWLETHAVPIIDNGKKVLLGVTRDITERKLAAQRIEKLVAEQNTILDNRLVGIVTARDRKVIWANLAYEMMMGYSKKELVDMPTRQFYINEADYQSIGADYANISETDIVRKQLAFIRKDGQCIWLDVSGSILNKTTGESLWVFVDVTEIKLAEEATSASHSLLKSVIDTAPMRIFWKDTNLRYLGCNPVFAKDAGMTSPEEVIGKDDYEMGWANQAELYRTDDLAVIESGKAKLYFDEPQTTPSGKTIWLRTSKIPLKNQNNEPMGLLGIYEDITERKIAEIELRIAATAFESQEGIMIADMNRDILRVNRAFTKITGYSAEEVIGKNPRILSSGLHTANFYEKLWDKISQDGSWQGEIWNKRKDGEIYLEYLTITTVQSEDGAVTNFVATLSDITQSRIAAAEIEKMAFYDALTGLPNRRLLIDRLSHALAASSRSGHRGAVLFVDLDHFKSLNDTLGHDVGDLLLKQVGERLRSSVREGDTVSRLGGDEYVVMLEELSHLDTEAARQAEMIGNNILAALNEPYQLAMHEHRSTASIGITLFGNHTYSEEDLLKHADIAMYQAKKAGRSTLRFFDPAMQQAIQARVSLENDLRKALEQQQFQLYYQVQVDFLHHAIGVEALIRWIHPERGLISPFEFMPVVEETGLILPIGQWVLETACAQIKAWQQNEQTRHLTVSVNVSAKQFRQADFVSNVKAAIAFHDINPALLKLELTETLLLENIEDTIATMNTLKEIGIMFSLDDFGTGYSSLQYLRRLPLYQLKIDQSFVRDVAIDNSDQVIIRTIIAMAHMLNLNVIAEGVETLEQQQILLSNGCTHYQGYLFGKPLPIDEFEVALKNL
jgi:diguanylate cyclase (GGDEF)-like protein/PAS domain S-box-containing protein